MTLTVEDGTGLADSDSYVSLADCAVYHESRGNMCWSDAQFTDVVREAALRRATFYIDPKYRDRFPGYQTKGRGQSLEWPRTGAYVQIPDNGRSAALYTGNNPDYYWSQGQYFIASNVVPREILWATCEAALREMTCWNILNGDLSRKDLALSTTVVTTKITYGPAAPDSTVFRRIDDTLKSLLIPSNPYVGKVSR